MSSDSSDADDGTVLPRFSISTARSNGLNEEDEEALASSSPCAMESSGSKATEGEGSEADADPDVPSKALPSPIDLAVEMEKRDKTSPPTNVEKVRLIQTE